MKNVCILGSTGSIGTQTLEIIRNHPDEFKVVGLTCGHNIELFKKQIEEFKPYDCAVADINAAKQLSSLYKDIPFGASINDISAIASNKPVDIVVNALSGMMGIEPTYEAIRYGKTIAFANKETLVAGGDLIMNAVKEYNATLLPVDSEHSAIFQALQGAADNKVKKIILTASGGPFRGYTKEQLLNVTKEQALKHPNWKMGAKITIDSATMMNKGLEIIEACRLFNVPAKDIEVVVHPQSALHSAIEFEDGSIIGQMGKADMKVPIAYALSYPKRMDNVAESLDLFALGSMTFEKPDLDVFKCLKLAYQAIELGGSFTTVLNAANEEAVAAFLSDEISFVQIADSVEYALNKHVLTEITSINDIFIVEREARASVDEYIDKWGK